MKLGFLGLQLQRGFPLRALLARQLAATGHTGEAVAELSFAEGLKRSASIKRGARPEVCEEFLVCAKPLNLNVAYSLCSGHLFQMLRLVGAECHWSLGQF